MAESFGAAATHGADQPLVSGPDVRRFEAAATVHDRRAFVAELERLVREKLRAVAGAALPQGERGSDELQRKAARLRSGQAWSPQQTDLQRGRAELLAEFEQPHNLPLATFAQLARKSRQQIYKDIAARRLLALDVGRRGRRLPEWQLQSVPLQLTQRLLAAANDVDPWTVYYALMTPTSARGTMPPVAAVNAENLLSVARRLLNGLGIQEVERLQEAERLRAAT